MLVFLIYGLPRGLSRASVVAQMVKNPPAMQETWILSRGWEGPLEEGMTIHSSTIAQKIPVDRGAWRATVHGVAKSWMLLSMHRKPKDIQYNCSLASTKDFSPFS